MMRLIQMPNGLTSFLTYSDNSALCVSQLQADLCLHGDKIYISRYGDSLLERRRFEYKGMTYHFVGSNVEKINYLDLKNSDLLVMDDKGTPIELKPEVLRLLIYCQSIKNKDRVIKDSKIIGKILDYEQEGVIASVFAIADINSQEIRVIPSRGITNELLYENGILFFDRTKRYLKCLDFALQEKWKYKPDQKILPTYVTGPEVYVDLVIHSFGPARLESTPGDIYNGVQFSDNRLHYDTQLYALNISDGSVRWHVTIPKTIDNMVIVENKLYLSSTNEIHIIDPNSGKTEQVIETDLSDDYDHSYEASSLHIQDNKLYFCHPADACILVYSLDDLALLKRIDIPAPHTIREFEYFHKETGKLYFNLKSRFPSLYYHQNPVLELDPTDLESDLEFISGPEVEIELLPSEENKKEKEIWISIRDVPLDEALAYAEMHTENQAFYHGTHTVFETLHKTDDFNGKVHFRYSGSDRPKDEVENKLRILEKRFEAWAESNAFASTDLSKNVTLDTQYLG